MTREPLRSAMSIGNCEDTSLALPSDHTLSTGQRRVLDQVHTIKRTKSKQLKNGSLSPASKSIMRYGIGVNNVFFYKQSKMHNALS